MDYIFRNYADCSPFLLEAVIASRVDVEKPFKKEVRSPPTSALFATNDGSFLGGWGFPPFELNIIAFEKSLVKSGAISWGSPHFPVMFAGQGQKGWHHSHRITGHRPH